MKKKLGLMAVLAVLTAGAVFAQAAKAGASGTDSASSAKVAISLDLFPFYKGMIYTDDTKDTDKGKLPYSQYAFAPSIEYLVAPHFSIGGTFDLYFGSYEQYKTASADTETLKTFYLGVTAHGRYYPLSEDLNGFFLDTGIGYNKLTDDGTKIFDGLFVALKAGYKFMPVSGFFVEPSLSYVYSKAGGSIPLPLGFQPGLAIGVAF